MVVQKDGKRFVCLDKCDCRFKAFLNYQYLMVDALVALRNKKVDELMAELDQRLTASSYSEGPAGSDDSQGPVLKRARREVFDEIPQWCDVTVKVQGQEVTCTVMTAAQHRHKLWVELHTQNINLLLKVPDVEIMQGEEITPTVSEPHVRWITSRKTIRVKFYCAMSKKWRTKDSKVDPGNDFQDRVNAKAAELEEVYRRSHTAPPLVSDRARNAGA